MRTPAILAIVLSTALAAAGAATVVTLQIANAPAAQHGAGADLDAMRGGLAGDDPHAQLGMERPRFPQATGSVPTPSEAQAMPEVRRIRILDDAGFTADNGVAGGSGTLEDPYRITGLHVLGDLTIADTSACVEIAGNWIDRQLTLNWNGPCVWVHHNYIRDLRVNENVPRTGMDTGGLIELNTINYVGQIRHYDGEFRHNVVGPRDDASLPEGIFNDIENLVPFFENTRILNIDGWNQGLFHHNTVYGSVDLKLHGHHHGTGFLAPHSHYHGDGAPPAHEEDHTDRWASVSFTDNKVVDPAGYGLRYVDEMHSIDDRTANSESNMDLQDPHVHHTYVEIARNVLEGAGIWVDIFNADDRRHKAENPGWFVIADNTIRLTEREEGLLGEQFFGPWYAPNTAIWVWQSKEVQFSITGNTMAFQRGSSQDPLGPLKDATPWLRFGPDPTPTAVHIEGADKGAYTVAGNTATGFAIGLKGSHMGEEAFWAAYDNAWGSASPAVAYDETVSNPPSEEPLPPGPGPFDEAQPKARHHGEHDH